MKGTSESGDHFSPEHIKELSELRASLEECQNRLEEELSRCAHMEFSMESHSQYLTKIIDAVPNIVFVKDWEGRYVVVNRAFSEFFCVRAEDAAGLADKDLIGDSSFVASCRENEQLVQRKGSEVIVEEEPVYNCRQELRWLRTVRRPLVVAEGEDPHILCVSIDITELKEVRENLAGEHSMLMSISENSPVGIVTIDEELRVNFSNKTAEKLLGSAGLKGVNITDSFSGRYQEGKCVPLVKGECPLCGVLRTGKPLKGEIFCTRNGDINYLRLNAAVLEGSSGIRIVCAFEDITEVIKMEERILESEARFRSLFENSPDGMVLHDTKNIICANRKAAELLGFERAEELSGLDVYQFIPEKDRDFSREIFVNALTSQKRGELFERHVVRKDGKVIAIETVNMPFIRENGKPGVHTVFRDISERKKRRDEILRLSRVVEQSPVSVVITDAEGNIEYVNPAFTELSGYTSEEALGENARILKSGKHPDDYYRDLWETIRGGNVWKGEMCNKSKNGDFFWELVSISPVQDEEGGLLYYVAVKENITEKKEQEERIQYLALHDSLTGLPNRTLMQDRLEGALARAERFNDTVALLYMDLDGFKQVNDSFGHKAGDLVLQEAANRINHCIRKMDTACRMGGDEFVVILQDTVDRGSVEMVAKRLLEKLSEPYDVYIDKCTLGVSIGVSIYPEHGSDPESLLKKADAAMYKVKNGGKNAYTFY
ncbi:PAS domain S-box protein [Limisalsivibrio acetivorans]|uniref:PAS domain S-box protein n=1 Tax=Limisalsivibrio acetivorans TaxID=1304888 RepID=UPI0003B50AF7|nr:PAS domain S-box protein [Limisalsivibrio acetivorans]